MIALKLFSTTLPFRTNAVSLNCMSPPAPVNVIEPSHSGLLSLSKTLYHVAVPVASTGMPVRPIPLAIASPFTAAPKAGLDNGTVAILTAGLGSTSGPDGLGDV